MLKQRLRSSNGERIVELGRKFHRGRNRELDDPDHLHGRGYGKIEQQALRQPRVQVRWQFDPVEPTRSRGIERPGRQPGRGNGGAAMRSSGPSRPGRGSDVSSPRGRSDPVRPWIGRLTAIIRYGVERSPKSGRERAQPIGEETQIGIVEGVSQLFDVAQWISAEGIRHRSFPPLCLQRRRSP